MEETKHTDKEVLMKGVKIMLLTAVLMFLGPTLFYIGMNNQEKALFIPIMVVASIVLVLALYFMYKGLKTIMNSMFGPKK
ncbi:DUF6095 family protein [Psychroserpens sp.]|uniref:DUF6095 family protein n=1 Tax=Psychroserpens sp. TaxID=2020870 RepID=UPI001AFD47C4|nr:DUF6095 family protein [Psychroserpens sp.]MBO6606840.1 hypothetical protein [Psychroserpens sp.]MBO6632296.1 hypothetical protein [Psychroserpens sp.]MBO6653543.1 hypothetical protein [Psychroserpens sp.]MBO6680429.1 hypothetical protein [Psychroserpens sp.]MBO6750612.1 hypothetical protein [Psychroserpens sp.]